MMGSGKSKSTGESEPPAAPAPLSSSSTNPKKRKSSSGIVKDSNNANIDSQTNDGIPKRSSGPDETQNPLPGQVAERKQSSKGAGGEGLKPKGKEEKNSKPISDISPKKEGQALKAALVADLDELDILEVVKRAGIQSISPKGIPNVSASTATVMTYAFDEEEDMQGTRNSLPTKEDEAIYDNFILPTGTAPQAEKHLKQAKRDKYFRKNSMEAEEYEVQTYHTRPPKLPPPPPPTPVIPPEPEIKKPKLPPPPPPTPEPEPLPEPEKPRKRRKRKKEEPVQYEYVEEPEESKCPEGLPPALCAKKPDWDSSPAKPGRPKSNVPTLNDGECEPPISCARCMDKCDPCCNHIPIPCAVYHCQVDPPTVSNLTHFRPITEAQTSQIFKPKPSDASTPSKANISVKSEDSVVAIPILKPKIQSDSAVVSSINNNENDSEGKSKKKVMPTTTFHVLRAELDVNFNPIVTPSKLLGHGDRVSSVRTSSKNNTKKFTSSKLIIQPQPLNVTVMAMEEGDGVNLNPGAAPKEEDKPTKEEDKATKEEDKATKEEDKAKNEDTEKKAAEEETPAPAEEASSGKHSSSASASKSGSTSTKTSSLSSSQSSSKTPEKKKGANSCKCNVPKQCDYAYCLPRSNAFEAPCFKLRDIEKKTKCFSAGIMGSQFANQKIIDDGGGVNFEFAPRPDYGTEVTFSVEPRKAPLWKTMMRCGFVPVINCGVPPATLSGKNGNGFYGGIQQKDESEDSDSESDSDDGSDESGSEDSSEESSEDDD